MGKNWSLSDIGDLSGKTAVITGGNTGLGKKTALELARRGAEVVIGSRSADNGAAAVASIQSQLPNAKTSYQLLDLTDFASIENFSDAVLNQFERLDILLHNSGLGMHPRYELAATGRELQMQINHLGHFALTCRLMPLILTTPAARIAQSNTVPYYRGNIDFDDFDWKKREYHVTQAYCDSRLAQILFAQHMNSEFKKNDIDATAVSMQPGLVATEGLLDAELPGGRIMKAMARPVETGCYTHLRACTDPDLDGSHFLEPRFVLFGKPTAKTFKAPALDLQVARRLVDISAELAGTPLDIPTPSR